VDENQTKWRLELSPKINQLSEKLNQATAVSKQWGIFFPYNKTPSCRTMFYFH
jgi:hypothetical protein